MDSRRCGFVLVKEYSGVIVHSFRQPTFVQTQVYIIQFLLFDSGWRIILQSSEVFESFKTKIVVTKTDTLQEVLATLTWVDLINTQLLLLKYIFRTKEVFVWKLNKGSWVMSHYRP